MAARRRDSLLSSSERREFERPIAPRLFADDELQQVEIDVIQVLNGALTVEQYQQLSAELREVIAANADATRQLIQDYGATFAQIHSLTAQELRELFNSRQPNRVSRGVIRLVNEARIPLADLLALAQPVRAELFNHSLDVLWLVNSAHIPLANLLELDQPIRTEFLNRSPHILHLINEQHIPFEQLSGLTLPQLRTVIANPTSEESQAILNPPASGFRASFSR